MSFFDLHPSPICLGTGDLGSTVEITASFALLDAYLDMGGNFLDTAKVYADWLPGVRSISEKTLGEWMRQRHNRSRIVLGTKGAHPDLRTMQVPRLSRQDIEADIHASLRHLQTHVIDLYWLHRDDPSRPVEDILFTLEDAVRSGKIRYYGCSNWGVERIRQATEYAKNEGLLGFAANQPMWNMAVVDSAAIGDPTLVVMDDELWRYHLATQLPAIPYSATANGLFQKLERNRPANLDDIPQKHYRSPDNLARYDRAQRVADRRGLTLTQVVLGYLLSQPFPVLPIVGPKRIDQLSDCLTAVDVRLDTADISFIQSG